MIVHFEFVMPQYHNKYQQIPLHIWPHVLKQEQSSPQNMGSFRTVFQDGTVLKLFTFFWLNHLYRSATGTQFASGSSNLPLLLIKQVCPSFVHFKIFSGKTHGQEKKWLNCIRFIGANVQIRSVTAGCLSAKVQVKCLWWRGFAKSANILCLLMNCQENPSQFKAQPLRILSSPCLHKSLVWPLLLLATDPLVRSQACVWRRPWPVNIGQSPRANGARVAGCDPWS